jgi:hypothetical protein
MSILRGMASVLAGVGTGLVSNKEEAEKKARQDKVDAWLQEQQDRQRQGWKEDDALKAGLKDAGAVRTAQQGTVTESNGQKLFSADPAQAAQLKNMTESIAELEGTGPVNQTQGSAITGNMSKGHEITTGPLDMKKLQELNSPQSVAERQAQTYSANGKPLEANQMRASAMDLKLKQLGLSKAEADWGDMEFDRMLKQKVPMGPGFGHAFAKVLTDTNVGGLAGVKYEAVYAPDGKSFEMVGVGPDGTKHSKGKFTDDDAGWAQAMQRANSASLATKIGYVAEAGKAAREAEKLANETRKVDIAEIRAGNESKKTDALIAGVIGSGRGSGGGGGGSGGGSASSAMPDPMAGFDSKKAYAVAADQALAELAQGGKPATPEAISQRATAIYRAMEGEFKASGQELVMVGAIKSMAQMAQTPQQMQAVAQRALAAGYSIEQLAAINPRFAALAQAKDTGAGSRNGSQDKGDSGPGKPSAPGFFTSKTGQVQLLQPLINLKAWNRKITDEANAEQAARGY